jgi:hypothetical protein
MCESREDRKNAFEAAKAGIDFTTVDRVMKGLPVFSDHDPKTRELRRAWSRYHAYLR